ncbi:hypothetical protein BC939DRAFT_453321 [Gamsiella multidivaricata]|uniref:uncharacterized protein n=1 Tax=Gamsiella multidivaricata TaxID=101098 RepID=UPI00221F97A3|nr:uncharacterized protein BC939DRAFT_453321 [Gamsiella multidivaricata]KAI7822687.1 hypothetical protein BC939DRAFT_453321 [Gamsiella multidivaricata]
MLPPLPLTCYLIWSPSRACVRPHTHTHTETEPIFRNNALPGREHGQTSCRKETSHGSHNLTGQGLGGTGTLFLSFNQKNTHPLCSTHPIIQFI